MDYEDCTIDFPCPECQDKFQIRLYQMFREESFIICPSCGATSSGGELDVLNRAFKKLEIELLNINEVKNEGNFYG